MRVALITIVDRSRKLSDKLPALGCSLTDMDHPNQHTHTWWFACAHVQDMVGVVRSVTVLDCMHDAVTTLGRDDIIFDYRRATFPGMAQPFIASVQLALTRDADGGAWQRARRNLDRCACYIYAYWQADATCP